MKPICFCFQLPTNNLCKVNDYYLLQIVSALVLGVCLAQPQRRPQSDEDDFQPQLKDNKRESTTFIPIIRFDKEQGNDGSYKAA